MKTILTLVALFACGTMFGEKITNFEKNEGKGGTLWPKNENAKFSYAVAPDARGTSAKLEWQEKRSQAILVVDFWYPVLAATKTRFDGILKMSFLPGPGKEKIKLLTVKFMDAKGEIFQWRQAVTLKDVSTWQQITFDVNPDTFADSYGKDADKKIDLPVRFYGIVVTFDSPVSPSGWIYFDDIEFINN